MKKFLSVVVVLFLLPLPAFALDEKVVNELLATSVTISAPDGTGSGAVITRGDRSYILTAAHVVAGCRSEKLDPMNPSSREVVWEDVKIYQLLYKNGEVVGKNELICEVIRYSPVETGEDLAVLLVKKEKAFDKGVKFSLGKKVPYLGQELIHVGSPFGDFGSNSVVPAWYSGYDRKVGTSFGRFDQITCPTFPGSSGGLVTDLKGNYLGMVQRGVVGGCVLIKPIRSIHKWSKLVGVEFLLDPKLLVPSEEELKKGKVE